MQEIVQSRAGSPALAVPRAGQLQDGASSFLKQSLAVSDAPEPSLGEPTVIIKDIFEQSSTILLIGASWQSELMYFKCTCI